ncbi:MAG: Hpt domain-containing protein [Rubrivivax sp.]|nr:Hpt domain-containing protein [Rubrivivax sp.]
MQDRSHRADETAAAAPPLARARAPLPIDAVRGQHLLLVEARPMDELVATELLQGEGGAMLSVAGGLAQALAQLEAGAGRAGGRGGGWRRLHRWRAAPGADTDGDPALRARLRAWGARHRCGLVALGAAGGAAGPAAPEPGFHAWVAKPLEPQALFAALAGVLAPPPAVSFELGLARCLGRPQLYERVARRFLEQGRASLQDLERNWRQGDRVAAARGAHSLVSTAGTLGATALSDAARALYAVLAAGRPPGVPGAPSAAGDPGAAADSGSAATRAEQAAMSVLHAESARVRRELERYLAARGADAGEAPA